MSSKYDNTIAGKIIKFIPSNLRRIIGKFPFATGYVFFILSILISAYLENSWALFGSFFFTTFLDIFLRGYIENSLVSYLGILMHICILYSLFKVHFLFKLNQKMLYYMYATFFILNFIWNVNTLSYLK